MLSVRCLQAARELMPKPKWFRIGNGGSSMAAFSRISNMFQSYKLFHVSSLISHLLISRRVIPKNSTLLWQSVQGGPFFSLSLFSRHIDWQRAHTQAVEPKDGVSKFGHEWGHGCTYCRSAFYARAAFAQQTSLKYSFPHSISPPFKRKFFWFISAHL